MEIKGLEYIGDDIWEDDPSHRFHTHLSEFLTRRDQLVYSDCNVPFTDSKIEYLECLLHDQELNELYFDSLKTYIRINGKWAKEFHYFVDDGGEGYLYNSNEIESRKIIEYVYAYVSGFELSRAEQIRSYKSGYKTGLIHNHATNTATLLNFFACHVDELNFVTSEQRLFIKDFVWVCYPQDVTEILIDDTTKEFDEEQLAYLKEYVELFTSCEFERANELAIDSRLRDVLRQAGDYYVGLLRTMYNKIYFGDLNPSFLFSKINSDKQYAQ